MAHSDIEAIIWCPHCAVDKFRVVRVPVRTVDDGVFTHQAEPLTRQLGGTGACDDCGATLERKK